LKWGFFLMMDLMSWAPKDWQGKGECFRKRKPNIQRFRKVLLGDTTWSLVNKERHAAEAGDRQDPGNTSPPKVTRRHWMFSQELYVNKLIPCCGLRISILPYVIISGSFIGSLMSTISGLKSDLLPCCCTLQGTARSNIRSWIHWVIGVPTQVSGSFSQFHKPDSS
jgi:hypothetical protein